MKNYDYVLNELNNHDVEKVYRILGPFDFYVKREDGDLKELLEPDTQRYFDHNWTVRKKSGNKYRGEVLPDNQHPDGRGFKVFGNGGVYEGDFSDGKMWGYGRGVSTDGNAYEGEFI